MHQVAGILADQGRGGPRSSGGLGAVAPREQAEGRGSRGRGTRPGVALASQRQRCSRGSMRVAGAKADTPQPRMRALKAGCSGHRAAAPGALGRSGATAARGGI